MFVRVYSFFLYIFFLRGRLDVISGNGIREGVNFNEG